MHVDCWLLFHSEEDEKPTLTRAAADAECEAARAVAREQAKLEREAVAVAATARQVLACEGCGRAGAGGLCEACGCRRETEALTVRTAQLVPARSLAPSASASDAAALDARVRTAIGRKAAAEWSEFLEISDPDDLDADQARAELAAALAAHSTVQQIADQAKASALAAFGRTDEADTEADRAYRTEQGRRWFQPHRRSRRRRRDESLHHRPEPRRPPPADNAPGADARAGRRGAPPRPGPRRGRTGCRSSPPAPSTVTPAGW
ncbi:hypothetical protein [Streptomyces sp. NPDC008125]|uniref:hypothetical protein n=1 Tax=Streptomyces sp. NPDC008125 TaxID=3364811 RepID=UPI0036ED61AA